MYVHTHNQAEQSVCDMHHNYLSLFCNAQYTAVIILPRNYYYDYCMYDICCPAIIIYNSTYSVCTLIGPLDCNLFARMAFFAFSPTVVCVGPCFHIMQHTVPIIQGTEGAIQTDRHIGCFPKPQSPPVPKTGPVGQLRQMRHCIYNLAQLRRVLPMPQP